MPEPGLAWALYYRIAKDPASGRKAVEWALGDTPSSMNDVRQWALVFDWCAPLMNPQQTGRLGMKLERWLAASATGTASGNAAGEISRQSVRTLVAVSIADRLPDQGDSVLGPLIKLWWRGDIVKRIDSGQPAIPREQIYALFEMLHAIRDNLKIDLRESASNYFKSLPTDHLVSHYPRTYQAAENEYRIPVYTHPGDPDLTEAVLSRAAELAMVAYDSNAAENQFLQGWLMQDHYVMAGALGSVYEFLWANPYQPGLSYLLVPLVFHDGATGHVFARTSWDDDATWIGYFDGHLQLFRDGQVQALKAGSVTAPVRVGEAVLLSARDQQSGQFHADAEAVFVLGLTPRARYDVEIDDMEMSEEVTDTGGTLVLSLPEGTDTGVRITRRQD